MGVDAMNEHVKDFATRIRAHELFPEWIAEIDKKRPVVPTYEPTESSEEERALLERIKFETARQRGFDLFRLLITGTK